VPYQLRAVVVEGEAVLIARILSNLIKLKEPQFEYLIKIVRENEKELKFFLIYN